MTVPQVPLVLLQVVAPQVAQVAPLVPHWVLLSLAHTTQLVPLQHPDAQLPALQLAAVLQVPLAVLQVFAPQDMQVWPLVPHIPVVSVAHWTQVVPLQQP